MNEKELHALKLLTVQLNSIKPLKVGFIHEE